MSLGVGLAVADDKLVEFAEQILSGSLPVRRYMDRPLVLHGYPQDIQTGPPTLQLVMASLESENILLRAFEQTHDQRFLNLATRRVLDFAAYERGQWQDSGFLWNDHAVGARIAVLTRLWLHMRQRPDFSAASSSEIVSLVERSGRLLAKPGHFTVRTNHGVVQNLALLQIAAAFPALPESPVWRQLAINRLNVQLPFYVSQEGFVLEHSAEYHLFGTELLAMAMRLCVLNGLVPEPSWVEAAQKSRSILARLMRPDGTLPLFGNTNTGSNPIDLPAQSTNKMVSSLFPLSGYAIWWQTNALQDLAQTLVVWAKHDGHGHKHADEGSVLFWSNGTDWITNTGYWPYDAPNEQAAYSWTGSNAPHQPGEDGRVSRTARLLTTGEVPGVRFIEVERHNRDGALFRRQVLQIDAQTLLVLDFANGLSKGSETTWTISPALKLMPGTFVNSYISSPAPDGRQMHISYATRSNATLQIRRGSEQPFAGWVVVNGQPTPADALQIVDPANSSAGAVLFTVVNPKLTTSQKISIETGATADQWTVTLEGDGSPKQISRSDAMITLANGLNLKSPTSSLLVPLVSAPDISKASAALKSAYKKAIETYPPWRDLSFYRIRLTYVLVAIALLVELAWFSMSSRIGAANPRNATRAHIALAVCWAAIAIWVFWIYLR